MAFLQLSSSDGQLFSVTRALCARMFKMIETMLEDLGIEEGLNEEIIPVPNVRGRILSLIINWAEHHLADPETANNNHPISQWDKQFFAALDNGTLFELISGARYLDMNVLLKQACKTVSNKLVGKSAEEIRREFNIENDLSPEEQERLRQENSLFE